MSNRSSGLTFGRSHFEVINRQKVLVFLDFAYAEFFATDTFFSTLRRIQVQVTRGEVVDLGNGIEADLNTLAGSLTLQLELQALEAERAALTGLAKLGLRIENKLLQLQVGG